MKELVILSGKGGTGKTAVAASLASLQGTVMAVDCDVDAPNLYLILRSTLLQSRPYLGLRKAQVCESDCNGCGKCAELCRFSAIQVKGRGNHKKAKVDQDRCEGCALCPHICPQEAIVMEEHKAGEQMLSKISNGWLIHGLLEPPAENSGMFVAQLKKQARSMALEHDLPLVLIDGPPGIGCPAIASLSGADMCLLVSEPTSSGLHDLERAVLLARGMRIPVGALINRYDLNLDQTKAIEMKLMEWRVPLLGLLPYDEMVPLSIARGEPTIKLFPGSGFSQALEAAWAAIKEDLGV